MRGFYIGLLMAWCLAGPMARGSEKLLPSGWDGKQKADEVMKGLVRITAAEVKGAHDAEFVLVGRRAFVVAELNDERAGESAEWPSIYVGLSVVNLDTLEVEKMLPFARSEQQFKNVKLPVGACFVPRILQKDEQTLRCYFASEAPKQRQSQMWFIDFDLKTMAFAEEIHPVKLKTAAGTFEMQPQYFHADAAAKGFKHPARDFGLYIFDAFKRMDGRVWVALNNYPGSQNALAMMNEALDTFEVVGHYHEPWELRMSESAVNRMPDGSWLAICRQEGGNRNYLFTTSADGRNWSKAEHWPLVPNGASSKPTLDVFDGVYYLGWQEATQINGVSRSVFNVEVTRDGKNWERKYRFESEKSFQYPAFHEHEGVVYVAVTQGDSDPSRKERIMFGRLESLEKK